MTAFGQRLLDKPPNFQLRARVAFAPRCQTWFRFIAWSKSSQMSGFSDSSPSFIRFIAMPLGGIHYPLQVSWGNPSHTVDEIIRGKSWAIEIGPRHFLSRRRYP